jgi:integrase
MPSRVPHRSRSGIELDAKTDAGVRELPLVAGTAEALREHRRRHAAERLAPGPLWVDTGHVFTTATGTPLDPRNVNRWWSALCERAGVAHRRFHAARHAAATLLLEQGPARVRVRRARARGARHHRGRVRQGGHGPEAPRARHPRRQGVTHFTVSGLWGSARHLAAPKDTSRTNPVCEVT